MSREILQKDLKALPKRAKANMVIIRPDRKVEDIYYKLKSGLIVPTQWDAEGTAVVSGTVIGLGEVKYSKKAVTRHGGGGAAIEVDTDDDIRVGDEVFYRYNAAKNAYEAKRVLQIEGEEIYSLMIYRDEITCVIREGEIIACNGNIIMERVLMNKPSSKWIDIPENFVPDYHPDRGTVVAVPSPVRQFWWERHYGPTHNEFKPGDVLIFGIASTLDNKVVKKYDWDLIRAIEPDIVAKVTGDGVEDYAIDKDYIALEIEPVKNLGKVIQTVGHVLDSRGKKIATNPDSKGGRKLYRWRIGVVKRVWHGETDFVVGERVLIRAQAMGQKLPDGLVAVRKGNIWSRVNANADITVN